MGNYDAKISSYVSYNFYFIFSKKRATDKKGSMILEVWESYREHREIAANKKWIKRDNLFGKMYVYRFIIRHIPSVLQILTGFFFSSS